MANAYSLEATFKLIDRFTAPLNKIEASSNAVSNKFKTDILKTQQQLSNVGAKLKTMGKFAVAGGMGALALATKQGVTNMLAMDKAMAKVSTIADTSAVPLKDLKSGLLKVSNLGGVAFTELAEAQYQAISGGIGTAHSINFVETALKAAKGGFTDTATAVDGLTSVLNAYQLGADKATLISDQMLMAQNLGKTTFGEMAQTMGKVIPIASTLGVSTGSFFASIATLTNMGIQTSEAMTGLKAAFSSILGPSSQASKVAKKLGISFNAASLKAKGLPAFLDEIEKKTGGNVEVLKTLFGSTEAVNAVIALTGAGAGKFNEALKAMENTANATNKAFEKVQADRSAKFAIIGNKIKNTFAKLGEAILPLVDKVMDKVASLADSLMTVDFSTVVAPMSRFLNIAMGVVSALWNMKGVLVPLIGIMALYKAVIIGVLSFQKLWSGAVNIARAVQFGYTLATKGHVAAMQLLEFWAWKDKVATVGLTAAQKIAAVATAGLTYAVKALKFAFVSSPIGWIVLGIGFLIAAIVVCIKKWDQISASLAVAWGWVKNVGKSVWGLVSAFGGLVSSGVLTLVNDLSEAWANFANFFTSGVIIRGIKSIGASILSGLLYPIQGLLELIAKIPFVGKKVQPAVDKLNSLRNGLTNSVSAMPIRSAQSAGLAPVSNAEQYSYYSRRDNYDHAEIAVRAERGSSAKVVRQPQSAKLNIVSSGAW